MGIGVALGVIAAIPTGGLSLAAGAADAYLLVFDALNVYANAPVDADVLSAPAIGSAASPHSRPSTIVLRLAAS